MPRRGGRGIYARTPHDLELSGAEPDKTIQIDSGKIVVKGEGLEATQYRCGI